jgi:hypothetical protein
MKRIFLIAVYLAAIAVPFLSACQKTVDAQAVWDQSIAAMRSLSSVATTITLTVANSADATQSVDLQATGILDNTGKSYLLMSTTDNPSSQADILVIGPDEYYVGSGSGESILWGSAMTAADFLQYGSFIFAQALLPLDDQLIASLVNPIAARDEKINGVSCYHITLQIDPQAYSQFLFGSSDPANVSLAGVQLSGSVEYWIGKSDLRFYRSQASIQLNPPDSGGSTSSSAIVVTSTIDYSNFNEPVTFPVP